MTIIFLEIQLSWYKNFKVAIIQLANMGCCALQIHVQVIAIIHIIALVIVTISSLTRWAAAIGILTKYSGVEGFSKAFKSGGWVFIPWVLGLLLLFWVYILLLFGANDRSKCKLIPFIILKSLSIIASIGGIIASI